MSQHHIHRVMQQAVALHQSGRFPEAEKIYREVLAKDPRNADALQLLGLLAHQSGKNAEAADLINKAITIRPRGEFFLNLGQVYRALGRTAEALEACRRAVQMSPNIPEAWNNLGSILKDAGKYAEAAAMFRKAIALRANYAVAHSNLGNALAALGDGAAAEASLRDAITHDPNYAEAYTNYCHLLTRLGRLDDAIAVGRRAIELKPSLAVAYTNLGTALHLQGWFDEGNAVYARGAQLDPANARLHGNLLAGFNYRSTATPQQALEAHREWSRRFASVTTPIAPHVNDRSPDRKLRIGYVSPDLRRHSVAYFLEPILAHHDREKFEITAYSNTETADDVTERLRQKVDRWRDILAMGDDQAAELIRHDAIDVLIDLAGHTTGNRLAVFGRKPAPVQMTYLGYANTTGLSTIDYRIADDVTDPVGMTETHYSEKLIRLPAPFLCYAPPETHLTPDVVEPPMLRNGFVTFGSFNKAAKVGPETILLWSKVLQALPSARLILKSRGLGSTGSGRRIISSFAAHGIDAGRIKLVEANQSLRDHLAAYGEIDIALDTFPYHGTTTTCEAMWMGVPVISRIGQTHVSRVGLTLHRSVGDDDLAVDSDDQFVTL
ncbi:MAG: hypothetical protein QOE14_1201, partial [Humisphaera sp.]|nr:hypothetical protein [Humisphaera sp.]